MAGQKNRRKMNPETAVNSVVSFSGNFLFTHCLMNRKISQIFLKKTMSEKQGMKRKRRRKEGMPWAFGGRVGHRIISHLAKVRQVFPILWDVLSLVYPRWIHLTASAWSHDFIDQGLHHDLEVRQGRQLHIHVQGLWCHRISSEDGVRVNCAKKGGTRANFAFKINLKKWEERQDGLFKNLSSTPPAQ